MILLILPTGLHVNPIFLTSQSSYKIGIYCSHFKQRSDRREKTKNIKYPTEPANRHLRIDIPINNPVRVPLPNAMQQSIIGFTNISHPPK